MKTRNMLVSLGGNAILKHTEKGTAKEQFENVRKTSEYIVELISEGYHLALTHGNGPQVGDILLAYDYAKDYLPPMPLDVCGAQSQGMIGYMFQLSLKNILKDWGIDKSVVTILTQTLVHPEDPQFENPSKPIGPFYTALEADQLRREKNWTIENDSGKGFRRLVPSPIPLGFVEEACIKTLYDSGDLVIASGGGGIPVTLTDGRFKGVECVIDKDYAASLLATLIEAEILLILTDVEKISLYYGTPREEGLDHLSKSEALKYLEEGHFPPGSMGPKVKSAIDFLDFGGKKVVVTSLESALDALKGNTGTTIDG
ncbi:MAG: carbamate kinase [Methanobacteriaceae archaeon]|nr:carbamate kinase [Methanobacteriaceae archaeon]